MQQLFGTMQVCCKLQFDSVTGQQLNSFTGDTRNKRTVPESSDVTVCWEREIGRNSPHHIETNVEFRLRKRPISGFAVGVVCLALAYQNQAQFKSYLKKKLIILLQLLLQYNCIYVNLLRLVLTSCSCRENIKIILNLKVIFKCITSTTLRLLNP